MMTKQVNQPLVVSESALTPSKKTSLEGSVVTLVPLDADAHLDDLYDNLCGPDRAEYWQWLNYGPFDNIQQFHPVLVNQQTAPDRVVLTIKDNASGKFVGMAAYTDIHPYHRGIMIGSVNYSGKLQRTTGATETVYLMIKHAFEDLGYLRVEWISDVLNDQSNRAARRLGFRYEGLLKKKLVWRGLMHDIAWYSITDDEWPLRRKAFETWLDPNNFDEQGVQKRSLSELTNNLE